MGSTKGKASLIGAPTESGERDRGEAVGTEGLGVAGLHAAGPQRGLNVGDCGNVSGPANPGLVKIDGYRNLAQVTAWNHEVHDAVYRELTEQRMPILLGGDHCLSIGSIAAVARHCRNKRKPLRVLWLDAHADFNTRELSPSGSLHGMPLSCLCGFGPRELLQIGGATPAISAKWVRQVGIRSVDAGERRFVHEQQPEVFDMRFIDEMGVRQTMELALQDLDADTHLHVSFDVDFLDPEIAPGVGTTVPGGLSYREAQLCMEMIADTGQMASLDIMELNPPLDVRNKTAVLAVDLVESRSRMSTLMRKPLSYADPLGSR